MAPNDIIIFQVTVLRQFLSRERKVHIYFSSHRDTGYLMLGGEEVIHLGRKVI